ncbi:hypothetical protein DPMN_091028 [Dreissena polymorpha]|uniref:Uncharacterized protein n=1 Tax=Dreissena polymorpha TaxID=45954 RepID=A0A9D4KYT4_DREPO|nr:hypothetical protein DPMN_091028 [Dreissena polymorpha]
MTVRSLKFYSQNDRVASRNKHRLTLQEIREKIVGYSRQRDRAHLDPSVGTVTKKPGQPPTSQKHFNTIYGPELQSVGTEFTCGLL